jgi:hypothetical protein
VKFIPSPSKQAVAAGFEDIFPQNLKELITMSVSGISSSNSCTPPHSPTDGARKLEFSSNADGSQSLELSRTNTAGSTVSATITKDADGNESIQITRTLADGSQTQRQLSINADGTFSGQASMTGKDGGTLESTSNGTYGDHALTYSRTAKYSTAGGTDGERTINVGVSAEELHRSVDGSGTTASGAEFTRKSGFKLNDHSIVAALKLSLVATAGTGGTDGTTGTGGTDSTPATGNTGDGSQPSTDPASSSNT